MIPKVSVIIATYNRPQDLQLSIQSVLDQTLKPFEILICDDGFDEKTKETIDNYNNAIIKWVPGDHAGRPAIPRNRGIKIAEGDWIAFLDDDDVWLPNKLERQFSVLISVAGSAICSNAQRIQNGKNLGHYFDIKIPSQINFNKLINTNFVITSSVVVEKNIIEKVGGFPSNETLIVGEDYVLWLKIASLKPIYYVSEPLLVYKDEPTKSIRQRSKEESEQKADILQEFILWSGNGSFIIKNYRAKIELWINQHPSSIISRIILLLRWEITKRTIYNKKIK